MPTGIGEMRVASSAGVEPAEQAREPVRVRPEALLRQLGVSSDPLK